MNFPNLSRWILDMSVIWEVGENDQMFLEVLIKNGFIRTTPFQSDGMTSEENKDENEEDSYEVAPEIYY